MSEAVYTDLDTVKAFLSPTGSTSGFGSNYDDQLTGDIAAAARWIDERTNRRFWPDADALQVRKFLPQNPGYCIITDLVTLTSLVTQGETWVIDEDFYLEPVNAAADGRPYTAIRCIARPFIFTLSQLSATWAGFDGRIQVTGKFGWAAVPPQIAKANVIQAARYFHRRNAPLGVISFSTELGFRMAGADADVASLVDPFALQVLF